MALRQLFALVGNQGHSTQSPQSYRDLKKLPDEELLDLLKQGGQDALAVLFDRYHRMVLNVGLRVLGNRAEAEDVMQEVFFETYRAVGNFNSAKGTFKRWLLLLATHRSLNRRGYLNRRKFFDANPVEETEAEKITYSPSCWGGLTIEECSHLIEEGMKVLNEKQRRILELEYFHGFLLSEVAQHMNESLHNVRNHHYRALEKLRKILRVGTRLEPSVAPGQESSGVKR